MNEETKNMETLTPERLSEFRKDVDSLRQRNQRFAQMLVEDFELLIAMAEQVETLQHELEARRVDSEQLARMSKVISAAMSSEHSLFGSECDHAEAVLNRLVAENARLHALVDAAAYHGYGKCVTAELERLHQRIDQLTEYLRHGPNCPADISNLDGLVPGKCDCGLAELISAPTREKE